jgi:hypothetical protein
MGNGNALADAGAAEALTGNQGVEYLLRRNAATGSGNQVGGMVQQAFLADALQVVLGAISRQ